MTSVCIHVLLLLLIIVSLTDGYFVTRFSQISTSEHDNTRVAANKPSAPAAPNRSSPPPAVSVPVNWQLQLQMRMTQDYIL